jgi:hypothetical protein
MMAQELESLDVSQSPEMLRLAEDVARTGLPKVLERNGEALAVVRPVATRRRRSHGGRQLQPNAWLAGLVGIAESMDGANVSGNIHQYIADVTVTEGEAPTPE